MLFYRSFTIGIPVCHLVSISTVFFYTIFYLFILILKGRQHLKAPVPPQKRLYLIMLDKLRFLDFKYISPWNRCLLFISSMLLAMFHLRYMYIQSDVKTLDYRIFFCCCHRVKNCLDV